MRYSIVLVLVLALFLVPGLSQAGEFYVSDDKNYWMYWEDNPDFQMLVPAKGEIYLTLDVFGERQLDITMGKEGPLLRIATVSRLLGGYEALKGALVGRWAPILSNLKVVEEREYTSNQGLRFKYFMATGSMPTGKKAMLRFASFFKGDAVVYMQLMCAEDEYTGSVKDQWLKAIHEFSWR